jgi:hypothetical protein
MGMFITSSMKVTRFLSFRLANERLLAMQLAMLDLRILLISCGSCSRPGFRVSLASWFGVTLLLALDSWASAIPSLSFHLSGGSVSFWLLKDLRFVMATSDVCGF